MKVVTDFIIINDSLDNKTMWVRTWFYPSVVDWIGESECCILFYTQSNVKMKNLILKGRETYGLNT